MSSDAAQREVPAGDQPERALTDDITTPNMAFPSHNATEWPPLPGMILPIPATPDTPLDLDSATAWWNLVYVDGMCVELRAISPTNGAISVGYYTTPETFLAAVTALDGVAHVYSTINSVRIDLMARYPGRQYGNWKARNAGIAEVETVRVIATTDEDIETEHLFVLDIDPARPSGVSSTDAEMQMALDVAAAYQADFAARGVESTVAMSGNGAYVIVPVPARPFDDGAIAERKGLLDYLATHRSTSAVEVDVKVANPSRILKCIGTMAMKGVDSPETGRLHRRSRFVGGTAPVLRESIYEVYRDEMETELASRPVAARASESSAGTQGTKTSGQIDRDYEGQAPDNRMDRARAYLARRDGAVTGEGGHNRTFSTAMTLVEGFALSDADACTLLAQWNANCKPPWSAAALGHKLRSALDRIDPAKLGARLRDGRSQTSAANGAKGGRPAIDTAKLANDWADELRDQHGVLKVRYYRGNWYRHDGSCYGQVSVDDVRGLAMEFLRRNSGGSVRASRAMRDDLVANLQSPALAGLPAQAVNPCWMRPGYLGTKGWLPMAGALVNVANLARSMNGEEFAHGDLFAAATAELFTTYGLEYGYDPNATCPTWDRYLLDVLPNENDREMLCMFFGLCLIPNTDFDIFVVFYGPGGTGKSVALEVLRALVGKSNVCCVPLADFGSRFRSGLLAEHLLNIVGDMPTETGWGRNLHAVEGILKDVCSGGLLPLERKYSAPTSAPAMARCVFASNSLPRFVDRSAGIWRRLRIIPFEQVIVGTGREVVDLSAQIIRQELPGIFNWAVGGLARLLRLGVFPDLSPRGTEIKAEHRQRCDPERAFLDEYYEAGSQEDFTESRTLYSHYASWCRENGCRAKSEANLSHGVQEHFRVTKSRVRLDGRQATVYTGLRCRTD